jgi:uncharacterized membrane protein YccF (DUF307 family)
VRTLLNPLWLILAGIWLAIEYVIDGAILCTTVVREGVHR